MQPFGASAEPNHLLLPNDDKSAPIVFIASVTGSIRKTCDAEWGTQ